MATNNSANIKTAGIVACDGSGVFSGRTITGTANQVTLTNGDGTAGNPTVSLTSTIQVSGISFDSGSNTLSNYAASTFTPTITNTGSAPTVTYTSQVGRYTRIGNRVILTVHVILASYTAGTGNVRVSGLPITSNNTTNNNSICAITLVNVTAGASVLWYNGNLAPNGTAMDIVGNRSATTVLNLAAAGPAGTAEFAFSLFYEV